MTWCTPVSDPASKRELYRYREEAPAEDEARGDGEVVYDDLVNRSASHILFLGFCANASAVFSSTKSYPKMQSVLCPSWRRRSATTTTTY